MLWDLYYVPYFFKNELDFERKMLPKKRDSPLIRITCVERSICHRGDHNLTEKLRLSIYQLIYLEICRVVEMILELERV